MAIKQNPRGSVLVVASQFGCKVDFFDGETYEKLSTIDDVIAQPHEMTFDSNRRLVYLAHTYRWGAYGEENPKGHEISVIDPDSRAIVDVIDLSPFRGPHDVEFDPDADLLYASVELVDGRNGVVIVDPETRAIVGNVMTEAPNSHWLALGPGGTKAYVAHKEAPELSVIDLRERRVSTTIPVPFGTEEVASSPDGRFAFVATPKMSLIVDGAVGKIDRAPRLVGEPPPRLLKIDTSTDEVVDELEFNYTLAALSVSAEGIVAVTDWRFPAPGDASADAVPGFVHFVDGETMTLLGSLLAGELPFTTRFSDDGGRAFVANVRTGSVTVFDVTNLEESAVLDNNIGAALGGTHGMCFVPAT